MVTRKELALPASLTLYFVTLAALAIFHAPQDVVLMPSGRPEASAHLLRPLGYVLIAPASDVLDELTLLSVPQLIALVISVILVYVVVRVAARRKNAVSKWCEFWYGTRAFLILILAIVCAAALPRPMAALHLDDPEEVVFDIHSHTNFSHDARATFSVEANREWHRSAGFDVAFITDHRCFDGAAEGMRGNPKRAGDGTVLLSGIELPPEQRHLILLEPPNTVVPAGYLEAWCVRATAGVPQPTLPVMIETIPENLSWMSELASGHAAGISGVEISDGAPRGLAQSDRDKGFIVAQAARLDLAMLAGSNNHGWGRAAVAWNVMRVPGWRGMSPDSLGRIIESRLIAERGRAVTVLTRRSFEGSDPLHLAATLISFFGDIMFSMSFHEQLSWIAWVWILWALIRFTPRRQWSRPAA
jgi:hypothetical protein